MTGLNAIIVDTETTGFTEPVPVEIAWIGIDQPRDMTPCASFEQRYNPGKPIEFGAMATHRIIDADVADKPSIDTFDLPPTVQYIIGHNIDYDWTAMGRPEVKRICTLALSRRLYPDAASHTLTAMLFQFLDQESARDLLDGAHGAKHDVYLTTLLFSHLLTYFPKINTWNRLWEASERARIPLKMPLGKHRGTLIADLPRDYVEWCLKNMQEMDPYLRKALVSVVSG